MGKVLTHMAMSLDGYIANPGDGPDELFDWYWGGDVTVRSHQAGMSFQVDEASAQMLRDLIDGAGVVVAGRRLFDMTNGWDDNHPAAPRIVVVTHAPPEHAAERWPKTTFVSGVEAAIATAREVAGDKDVIIASPDVINQALDLGLVDEVCVSLVPVLFRNGIRYFAEGTGGHLMLDDPTVVQGRRAVHLRYPVRR